MRVHLGAHVRRADLLEVLVHGEVESRDSHLPRRAHMLIVRGSAQPTQRQVRDRGRLPEPNLVLALTGCDVAMTQMRGPLSCFVGRPKLDTWARAFKASLDRNR